MGTNGGSKVGFETQIHARKVPRTGEELTFGRRGGYCPLTALRESIFRFVWLNPRNEIIFKNQAVFEIIINIDTVALTQTWMLLLYSNQYVRSGPHWLWKFVLQFSLVWWQRMFIQHRFMVSKGKKLFFCGTTCLTTLRERGHSTSIWYPRWVLENDHTVPC